MAKHFESPDQMWAKFKDYVEWADANPITVNELVQKHAITVPVERARVLSVGGFMRFLTIAKSNFYTYKENENYQEVIGLIENYCTSTSFELACANGANPNLIQKWFGMENAEAQTPPSEKKKDVVMYLADDVKLLDKSDDGK